jgi:DNA-binding response OmpR family regulator
MNRILVVDDEPNLRLVYREVLGEEGYEVLEAESVKETFDILNREPVDLVVLDIKLRSESGLDVLQRITKEFPTIPVVLCSAYVSFQNDYTSWLADSYIVKSSEPQELLKEIRRVLSKRGKIK